MQTCQTGLIRSCYGAVRLNTVIFISKRLEYHSFSLVMMCLMKLDGSYGKTLKNMCLLANLSNRADSELFWSRLAEYGHLSVKTIQISFFFTCYDVFDVIGWFPRENSRKCEFCCKRVNGAVVQLFGTISKCFMRNGCLM